MFKLIYRWVKKRLIKRTSELVLYHIILVSMAFYVK